jgi:hypothetical protein
MSTYYFLTDQSIGSVYVTAGSTQSTEDVGGILPANFVPNGNCCALDAAARTAMYASSPQQPTLIQQSMDRRGGEHSERSFVLASASCRRRNSVDFGQIRLSPNQHVM